MEPCSGRVPDWRHVMEKRSDAARDEILAAAADAVRRAEERAVAGQLALEMMHEIKGPLEALGHLTYLAHAEAHDAEKVRKYMNLAEEQMSQLRNVASETLGFARTSQVPREVDAFTLAEAALRIHQRAIDAKGIRLTKHLPKDVTAEVHPGEMLQVLSNLIINAVDALPFEGRLFLRIRRTKAGVHFIIADNGHGISPELMSRIFQPFVTTKIDRGNGLGLALSKRIVEKHRGTIKIRSSVRPGRNGTTFRISLPANFSAAVQTGSTAGAKFEVPHGKRSDIGSPN